VKVALEVRREVALPAPPAPAIVTVRDMRKVLRSFVRAAWATDAGAEMSDQLSKAAVETGYATRLKGIAESLGLSSQYKSAAAASGISNAYKSVWGK